MNTLATNTGTTAVKNIAPTPKSSDASLSKSHANSLEKKVSTTPLEGMAKKEATEKADKAVETDKGPVTEYLKVISRLENKILQGDMKPEDLENALSNLEEQLKGLSTPQKNRLMNLAFFKKYQLENLASLKETLTDILNNPLEQKEGFDFLRSQELMQMLDPKSAEQAPTYGPNLGGNRNLAIRS